MLVDARTHTHTHGWVAHQDGDFCRIQRLVQRGLDVNQAGGSHKHNALHYAARFGHLETIETLLKSRADPNLQNADGRTPLVLSYHLPVCLRL